MSPARYTIRKLEWMADARTDLEMLVAARICAGLGSVLNWSGKTYSVKDFLPSKQTRPMIPTSKAIEMLLRTKPNE